MIKRIFAWALLAGFVLLILNLLVFRFYWKESMVIYLIIAFAFIFTKGNLVNFGGKNRYEFDGMDHDPSGTNDDTDGEDIGVNNSDTTCTSGDNDEFNKAMELDNASDNEKGNPSDRSEDKQQ